MLLGGEGDGWGGRPRPLRPPRSDSRARSRRESRHVCAAVPPSLLTPEAAQRKVKGMVAEEYRLGRLNKPDLRRLLGFETGYEIDGFLKAHNVYEDYTMEDFEREREALKSLRL
jgi:hypothetical protein